MMDEFEARLRAGMKQIVDGEEASANTEMHALVAIRRNHRRQHVAALGLSVLLVIFVGAAVLEFSDGRRPEVAAPPPTVYALRSSSTIVGIVGPPIAVQFPSCSASPGCRPTATVRVLVVGTVSSSLAATTRLKSAGYRDLRVSQGPDQPSGTVLFRDGFEREAQRIAHLLGLDGTTVRPFGDNQVDGLESVDIILEVPSG